MIKYVLLFFYFYKILTAFNKLKIISEVVLLLPNTDRLQQDYVRGCTWQLKKVKTTYIYRFHELVFDWGDNSLGCFNRWTQNYELWTDRLKTMSCEPIDSKLWVVNQSTQNYELWTDRLKSMGCEPIDSKIWAVNRSTQNYELWQLCEQHWKIIGIFFQNIHLLDFQSNRFIHAMICFRVFCNIYDSSGNDWGIFLFNVKHDL